MVMLIEEDTVDTASPRSQTTMAYGRLKQDILACRLAPDSRLKIADLAEELEVSPGAIREALSRLVPERLVVSRDQKGFVVAPLSVADLEDLTELRCEIEKIALRRSVERGGVEWEAELIAAAHRMQSTLQIVTAGAVRSLSPEWVDHHAAFHTALVAACGSPRLLALHASLYEQSERYRGMSAQVEVKRDVAGEHQALVDAALRRDADLLVALTVAHLRKTTSLIVDAARRKGSSSKS
jgi:GntR family carbon starvation induced transcriptional regulator